MFLPFLVGEFISPFPGASTAFKKSGSARKANCSEFINTSKSLCFFRPMGRVSLCVPLLLPMIVVTNRLSVAPGMGAEFEAKFERRARLVEKAEGFVRMEILRPIPRKKDHRGQWQQDDAWHGGYEVRTWWKSIEDFDAWRSSDAFRNAHGEVLSKEGQPSAQQLPRGLVEGPPQISFHSIIAHALKSHCRG